MRAKRERHTKEQFTALLSRKGLKSVYNHLGTLKYALDGNSFSVVTSGKHEKRATARNRVRRRIYTLSATLPLRLSGIFYASKQAYGFDYKKTKELFDDLAAQIAKTS